MLGQPASDRPRLGVARLRRLGGLRENPGRRRVHRAPTRTRAGTRTGRQWLTHLAVVPVDRQRLHSELPTLEVDLLDVLHRGRLGKVDRLADSATDERLHRGHHPDVAHRGDGPLPHGAVEHLVVLLVQARRTHHVSVLGDVLHDRLDLLLLVAQGTQRLRHRLVDELHRPAADQLLELHQRQVRLDAGGVTAHHQADGVVADKPVRDIGDVARHGQVVGGTHPAVLVGRHGLEQIPGGRALVGGATEPDDPLEGRRGRAVPNLDPVLRPVQVAGHGPGRGGHAQHQQQGAHLVGERP